MTTRQFPQRNWLASNRLEYKAITALNTGNNQGWVAEGSAATTITTATEDMIAVYKSFALADKVTFEQQWAGQTFLDTKATAVTNLLRATMIAEENAILFGQNTVAASNQQAPGAVGASPAPGIATATTGGAIAAATAYYFKQTVFTGMGESTPSTAVTVTTGAGSANSITLTPVFPAGQPVFGFNFYASTASGGTYYLVASANVAASYSGANLPGSSATTWLTNGQALVVTSIPGSGANPPAADGTASTLAYNGLVTQMFGGAGASLVGVNGTLTTTNLDNLLQKMWNAGRADPDSLMVNAQESIKITNLTLGSGAPYYITVDQQNGATGGFRVARLTNKVTGSELPVRVHPTIPQGLILALSSKLPGWYVPTDVPSVWSLDLVQDYVEIDYPPTAGAPVWQVEVRLFGTLKLHLPVIQGALYGIANN